MEEVSQDIHKFGRRVHKIQRYTKDINTPRDNEKLRSKLKAERSQAAKVNERIQKNIGKLAKNVSEGTDSTSSKGSGEEQLDSSSLSHRRQQLKKLKLQASELEKQYTEALRESIAKEKLFSRKPSLEEEEEEEYLEDALQGEDEATTPDSPVPNTTRGIVREQVRQQQERQAQQAKQKTVQQQQQQMQLDKQIKMVLSSSDKSTIDVEHMIASETLREVRDLELSYAELHSCFQDLNSLIEEQDPAFNVILSNVQEANKNVEMGVENIKVAKAYTAVGGVQKLTKKLGTIGKFL